MKPRIFIVEDEAVVALDIRHRLQQLGYEIAGMASSGEDAMSAVGALHPDLVLMDVNLGTGIDGIETAARIREQLHIPVVYITAFSDAELIARIRVTEPFAYILKPFEEAELHAAIEIALVRNGLETTIREQKKLLATTLDNIDDGVIVAGMDGTIRYMNPVAEALTGWTVDESVGRLLHDVYVVLPPSMLLARDGRHYEVDYRSNMMVDESGTWSGFVHTFTDVSEREASRRALEQREREYRMLMEQAADPIIIGNAEQRIVAVNSRACEFLGYPREEMLAMRFADIIESDLLAPETMRIRELQNGGRVHLERRLLCHDGRRVDVEISARGMSDGRIQVILHDITQRKLAEAEFRQAVRSEAVDKLLTKLHALRHGESAAMNLNRIALFLENLDSLCVPLSGGGLGTPSPVQRFHIAVQEFDDTTKHQLLLISSLMHILATDTAFRDAVRPVATDALKLRHATNSIRTALPEILALLGDVKLEERLQALARDIVRAIADIKVLTSDLHALLRVEFTCDVNAIVRSAVAKFRCQGAQAVINCEEGPAPLPVVMRTHELNEVLSTLVTNALEAGASSDRSGTPTIELRVVQGAGQRVLIEVQDNGPGISEEIRHRIFEDHFSTKGSGRGFGLGHALRCLQGCGGSLRLDNSSPSGSRFIVELARL
jgi:PAS domain S-box-containing protein